MKRVSAISLSLIATAVAVRVGPIFRYRFDSDEPQHMHVAWGWAHGLIQYRDVFDNHMPLFHLLSAPLVALVGERADILLVMRIAVLPLGAVALWGPYRLGSPLHSPRCSAWRAALTGPLPGFGTM